MRPGFRLAKVLLAVVTTASTVGVLGATPAHAASDDNWTGAGGNGLWSNCGDPGLPPIIPETPSNWSGACPPSGRLGFPASAAQKNMTNDTGGSFGGLEFTGGGYTLTGGSLTLTGNGGPGLLATGGASAAITTTITSLAGDTQTDAGSLLSLDKVNGGSIVKTGPGTLRLTGANTYDTTNIAAGLLQLVGNGTLGSGAVTIGNGTLEIGTAGTVATPFTLSGTGGISVPTGTVTLTGLLSGTGGLTKTGAGTLVLNNANTYGGVTAVNAGQVNFHGMSGILAAPATLGPVVIGTGSAPAKGLLVGNNQLVDDVTVNLGGILDMGGFNATITGLTLNGGNIENVGKLFLDGDAVATAPVGASGAVNTITGQVDLIDTPRQFTVDDGPAGVDALITGTITGADGLDPDPTTIFTKAGNGALIINGNVNVPVVVNGGTLGGNVVMGALTVTTGVLSPGTSAGTMQTGSLTLGSGARMLMEIAGSGASDRVVVTGIVNLAGATLDVVALGVSTTGQKITIIDNDGSDPVQSTFAGLAEGTKISAGSRQFTISYVGGTGNDVVLTDVGGAIVGGNTVTRLQGDDRIATAIAASNSNYPTADSAQSVVLATQDAFPDALGGTPLAVAKDGPLLLTTKTGLDSRVSTEIARVLANGATVYVLGGNEALSSSIDTALTTAGFTVTRLAGTDRYDTAVKIAGALGNPTTQILATGTNFPDALAGGAAAAKVGGAVLLTGNGTQNPTTASYLSSHPGTRIAIGGPAAAASAGSGAETISGADRYQTAVLVAQRFFTGPAVVGVASGERFPDALSGGAHIGKSLGPLLLTAQGALPTTVSQYLTANKATIDGGIVYGGPVAVALSVQTEIQTAIT